MQNQLASWLQSSQDPTTISNTVRGAVLAASGLIIFFASVAFHVTLTANDVVSLAAELGTLAGCLWTIYGIVMKGVMWLGTQKASTPSA